MNAHTKQYVITPAAGKRLIAKSMLSIAAIEQALDSATVVIVAGTTNGYVAEEVMDFLGQRDGFSRNRFFRGITMPASYKVTQTGRFPDESGFEGDVVIVKGKWKKGLTIFDVVNGLGSADVIIKGANALDLKNRQAGVLIGHEKGGTILAAMQAVAGRRVSLYLPVGLEKRIDGQIDEIARRLGTPDAEGPRMYPVTGHIVTELDAIQNVSGAHAELVAAGGVCGAEGSCRIAVSGDMQQLSAAEGFIMSAINEPGFSIE